MSKTVKPGNWQGAMVIMDRIPIVCPECGHEVTLRGGVSEDGQRFEVTECPHCHTPVDITISTRTDDDEEPVQKDAPIESIEVALIVKGLPTLSECMYRMTGMKSVSGIIDRVVNVISTILGSQEMNPNAIKDMYIRESLADIYTPEGKREIITELEAQIEKAEGN